MERLIKVLDECNKKLVEVLDDMKELNEDLRKIEMTEGEVWGNERDNKNEDSNFEREQ